MLNNIPIVTKNILIINILVYVVTVIDFQSGGGLHDLLAGHFINSPLFQPFQVVTHMFSHSLDGIFHILFNMLVLVMFGSHLERVWGAKRFFIFYFSAGIGAFLLYNTIGFFPIAEMKQQLLSMGNSPHHLEKIVKDGIFWDLFYYKGDLSETNKYFYNLYQQGFISENTYNNPSAFIEYINYSNRSMVGASGAIFGLLAAFAVLFPNTELMLLFPPIPIKAKYLIGGYLVYEIYMSFFSTKIDNIAHLAHVGGAIVGIVFVLYWRRTDRRNFY